MEAEYLKIESMSHVSAMLVYSNLIYMHCVRLHFSCEDAKDLDIRPATGKRITWSTEILGYVGKKSRVRLRNNYVMQHVKLSRCVSILQKQFLVFFAKFMI